VGFSGGIKIINFVAEIIKYLFQGYGNILRFLVVPWLIGDLPRFKLRKSDLSKEDLVRVDHANGCQIDYSAIDCERSFNWH